ncbi:tyrosine-type recombinase/integrase [Acrocarpospora sp. B8E8]|uniref:tyrosine-type recombinase/integrase n=1 Tax=Acrocarpospora sp. B8E8 TaxID=3153572 RepID=UPI00325D0697
MGRRDHALLLVALRTGLRVSELAHLACGDVHLGTGPYLRCTGKGRKDRCTPLDAPTVVVLRQWLAERAGQPGDPVFCTRQGRLLSRDAVQARLDKYHVIAVDQCPSLADKNLSPHTLRHSTAMRLRLAGVDLAVIALWLGHDDIKSTQKYLHADLELKERALARTSPPDVPPGRYKPPDQLLAFPDSL